MLSRITQIFLLMSLLTLGVNQATEAQGTCQVSFHQFNSGNTVYFNAIDSGAFNPLYVWTMSDAVSGVTTTLTGPNPSYTFSGASAYHQACVTLYDSVFNCQVTYCDTVSTTGTVVNNCNVSFTYSDSSNTAFFNGSSTGTVNATYSWQITDGNTNVTTNVWGQNPVFNFSGPSTYHLACVTVYDSSSNCQATYCDSVLIGNNNNCNVSFTYTDSANTTFFNANGSTPFANYFWQITDGNTNVTTNVWGQNPAFNFSGLVLTT